MKHFHDGEVIALPNSPVVKLKYAQQGADRFFESRGIAVSGRTSGCGASRRVQMYRFVEAYHDQGAWALQYPISSHR